jgi:hypothetical protein
MSAARDTNSAFQNTKGLGMPQTLNLHSVWATELEHYAALPAVLK